MDASFFGKRQDKFGLIVAKDVRTGMPVSYHFIQHETLEEYQKLREDIEAIGYKILSVTIDCIRRPLSDTQPMYARTLSRSCFGQLADAWSDNLNKYRLDFLK